MPALALDTAAHEFITYLEQVRRLSPHTVNAYRRDLEKLLGYCDTLGLNHVGQVHTSHIRQLVAQLHRQGLAGKSLQRLLSSIRSFFKHLTRQGSTDNNPALGVQGPKVRRRLPKVMDSDQINHLVNFKTDSWLTTRDKAILELFYSSGLRLAELVSLDMSDIDWGDALVRVRGKGNKTRLVPVGRMARIALQDWLKVRPEKLVDAGLTALFISQRGERLSNRNIQARIRLHGQRQAIDQPVHPHMLRHSFASHILESSGDLRAVQELLGHANIATTQIYTHMDYQHLARVYDNSHPRAKRKN